MQYEGENIRAYPVANRNRSHRRLHAYSPAAILFFAFLTGWNDSPNAEPVTVDFSSFIGAHSHDSASAISIDDEGFIYIAGHTFSDAYPVTSTFGSTGLIDATISKFSADGSQLIFSVRIGGSGRDIARDIAVDSGGNIYITGETDSFDFPVSNPWQQNNRGNTASTGPDNTEAFILKLGPNGDHLEFSSYFGGSAYDAAHGIALTRDRRIYIIGETTSPDLFMTEQNLDFSCGTDGQCNSKPARREFDAFFAVFDLHHQQQLVYSTYFGGTGSDKAHAITLHPTTGVAYIAGETTSLDLPQLHRMQNGHGGSVDGFIAGIDTRERGINGLVFSSYLGGSQEDLTAAITMTADGALVISGDTTSADFPVYQAFQKRIRGKTDIFIARIALSESYRLDTASYYGGRDNETIAGVSVDKSGIVYIAGNTDGMDLPVWNNDAEKLALSNGFVVAFASDLNSVHYATYYGGEKEDMISDIHTNHQGVPVITGDTESLSLPHTQGAFQRRNAGAVDVFIAALAAGENYPTGTADRILEKDSDGKSGKGMMDIRVLLIITLLLLGCRYLGRTPRKIP